MINAKSQVIDLAAEFMALANSPENVQAFIAAEIIAARHVGVRGRTSTPAPRRGAAARQAPAIVLPPDTGYDLKMADAFYSAIAEVLGGQATPAEALASIDEKLGR